jgi:hypothetical protein
MSPILHIRGLVIDEPEEPGRFRGPRLNKEEIGRTIKRFAGRPLFHDHTNTIQIGSILNLEPQPHGDIFVNGIVDGSTPKGRDAIEEIKSGKKRGLSIGIEALWTRDKFRFKDVDPVGVSLVEDGGIKRSRILSYSDGKVIKMLKGEHEQVYNTQIMEPQAAIATQFVPTDAQAAENAKLAALVSSLGITPENAHKLAGALEHLTRHNEKIMTKALDNIPNFAAHHYSTQAELDLVKNAIAKEQGNPEGMILIELTAAATGSYATAMVENAELKKKYETAVAAVQKPAEANPLNPLKTEDRRTGYAIANDIAQRVHDAFQPFKLQRVEGGAATSECTPEHAELLRRQAKTMTPTFT